MDERNWSALPSDVIYLIHRKLSDLLDFVQFRAVCKAWCSAASLSDLPLYLPWLLKCQHCRIGEMTMGDELCYYSVSSNRTGRIDIKDSTFMRSFRGPTRGYLLLKEFDQLSLFNPLTKETISLPYLYTSVAWPVWTGADSNLIHDQDIVVVNWFLNDRYGIDNWSFYNKENRRWITEYGLFISCCYFRGRLFCIDRTNMSSDTVVYDVSTGKRIYEIELSDDEGFLFCDIIYLVESAGEILRVSLRFDDKNVENVAIFIYKIHFDEMDGQPHWVKITSIGDQLLFLDQMNGFSMSSARFPDLKSNCIYFLSPTEFSKHGRRPYKYDIELGKVESLECPFECCCWFVPCLG